MWDAAVIAHESGQMAPKDFYPVFLSWLDDPDCVLDVPQSVDAEAAEYFSELEFKLGLRLTDEQRNFWVAQRRELGGDIFQEYPATPEEAFSASRDGTYYSRLFNEKCVRTGGLQAGLYDPHLPVDVYFDLGVDDYMVLGFVQWYRGRYRLIDEYWNNGYGLEHYLEEAVGTGYNLRNFVFPHDIKVRELSTGGCGRAKSRLDIVKEWIAKGRHGLGTKVLAKSSVADGIEAVRRMISKLDIDPKCTYSIDCLNNYSKEWDDKLQVWKKTPVHDEYSHGADMLRQVACGLSEMHSSHESSVGAMSHRRRASGHAV
jgi:hypothetical protein